MITKNAKFGNTEDVTVCELGTGDVWMLGSEKGESGETVMAFKTVDPPRPINVTVETSVDSFDEMEPELVFVFNKTESIDALISILQGCKEEMIGEGKEDSTS